MIALGHLLALAAVLAAFGVDYISHSDVNTPPAWGDGRSLAARVTPHSPTQKSAASPGRLAAPRLATSRAGERVRPARGEVNIMMPGELEPT